MNEARKSSNLHEIECLIGTKSVKGMYDLPRDLIWMEWSLKGLWRQFEVWVGLQLAPVPQSLCDPGLREERVQLGTEWGKKNYNLHWIKFLIKQ